MNDKTNISSKNDKPVLVFICGDGMDPSYEKLAEIKNLCEYYGQPFLLIPEPDANCNPSIPLAKLTEKNIEASLVKHMGKGGEYDNKNYIPLIYTHGSYEFEPKPTAKTFFVHQVNHDNHLTPKSLYKTIFTSCTGNPEGLFSSSCHSGGAILGMAETLNELHTQDPQRYSKPIPFFGVAEYIQTAQMSDAEEFVKLLPSMAEKNIPFSLENLQIEYHKAIDISNTKMKEHTLITGENCINCRMVPTIETTLIPGNYNGTVGFENRLEKLEDMYDKYHHGKIFEEFKPNDLINSKTIGSIQKIFNSSKESDEFLQNLKKENLWGAALYIADAVYDKKNKSHNNSELTQHDIENVIEGGLESPIIEVGDKWIATLKGDKSSVKKAFSEAMDNSEYLLVNLSYQYTDWTKSIKANFNEADAKELIKEISGEIIKRLEKKTEPSSKREVETLKEALKNDGIDLGYNNSTELESLIKSMCSHNIKPPSQTTTTIGNNHSLPYNANAKDPAIVMT